MKKRIISAAILVPILFLLTLAAPVIAASLVMSALMAIAAYELLYRTGLVKRPRLVIYSCIMAANFGLLTSLMITSTTALSRTSS